MSIDYSEIDVKVRMEYEDDPPYGMHETTDTKSGDTHHTAWNAETNSRTSYDIDSDGNVSNMHSTNQDYEKGDSRRH